MFKSKELKNPYLEKIQKHNDYIINHMDKALFFIITTNSGLPQSTVDKIVSYLIAVLDKSKSIGGYRVGELYAIVYGFENGYIQDIKELLVLIGSVMESDANGLSFDEYYDNLYLNSQYNQNHSSVRVRMQEIKNVTPNL